MAYFKHGVGNIGLYLLGTAKERQEMWKRVRGWHAAKGCGLELNQGRSSKDSALIHSARGLPGKLTGAPMTTILNPIYNALISSAVALDKHWLQFWVSLLRCEWKTVSYFYLIFIQRNKHSLMVTAIRGILKSKLIINRCKRSTEGYHLRKTPRNRAGERVLKK